MKLETAVDEEDRRIQTQQTGEGGGGGGRTEDGSIDRNMNMNMNMGSSTGGKVDPNHDHDHNHDHHPPDKIYDLSGGNECDDDDASDDDDNDDDYDVGDDVGGAGTNDMMVNQHMDSTMIDAIAIAIANGAPNSPNQHDHHHKDKDKIYDLSGGNQCDGDDNNDPSYPPPPPVQAPAPAQDRIPVPFPLSLLEESNRTAAIQPPPEPAAPKHHHQHKDKIYDLSGGGTCDDVGVGDVDGDVDGDGDGDGDGDDVGGSTHNDNNDQNHQNPPLAPSLTPVRIPAPAPPLILEESNSTTAIDPIAIHVPKRPNRHYHHQHQHQHYNKIYDLSGGNQCDGDDVGVGTSTGVGVGANVAGSNNDMMMIEHMDSHMHGTRHHIGRPNGYPNGRPNHHHHHHHKEKIYDLSGGSGACDDVSGTRTRTRTRIRTRSHDKKNDHNPPPALTSAPAPTPVPAPMMLLEESNSTAIDPIAMIAPKGPNRHHREQQHNKIYDLSGRNQCDGDGVGVGVGVGSPNHHRHRREKDQIYDLSGGNQCECECDDVGVGVGVGGKNDMMIEHIGNHMHVGSDRGGMMFQKNEQQKGGWHRGDCGCGNNDNNNKRQLEEFHTTMEGQTTMKSVMQEQAGKESGVEVEAQAQAAPSSVAATRTCTCIAVSRFISRHPRSILVTTISIAVIITLLVVFVGEFKVEEENKKGWKSRGTRRSKRGMQSDIIRNYTDVLFNDTDGDQWVYLTTNVPRGYFYLRESILRRIPLEEEEEELDPVKGEDEQELQQQQHVVQQEPSDTSLFGSRTMKRRLCHDATAIATTATATTTSSSTNTETRARALEAGNSSSGGGGGSTMCDSSSSLWYSSPDVLERDNLFAFWEATPAAGLSLLHPDAIETICFAEEQTSAVLEKRNLCGGTGTSTRSGCGNGGSTNSSSTDTDTDTGTGTNAYIDTGRHSFWQDERGCIPPLSLILVLRRYIPGGEGMSMTCTELASAYTNLEESFTQDLARCANELRSSFGRRSTGTPPSPPPAAATAVVAANNSTTTTTTYCPLLFSPQLVDKDFGINDNMFLSYSATYFRTAPDEGIDLLSTELFSAREEFGYGSNNKEDGDGSSSSSSVAVTVTYETNMSFFSESTIDSYILPDLILAAISGCLAFAIIAVHTGSLWLVLLGSLQIVFAIPLSYFVYYFIFRIKFFPLLNFIGFFVSAALGADDLFVASDKWKNYRAKYPQKSMEDIAALALPEAASAMLLTTSTTSVAFFATCLSPVAAIFCFAVFCGLMIVFNFVLNCALVFPGLCMYDEWLVTKRNRKNFTTTDCLVSFSSCKEYWLWRRQRGREKQVNAEEEDSLEGEGEGTTTTTRQIQRVMGGYYNIIHTGRWPVLIICLVGLGVSTYFAQTIALPEENEVRMLPPSHPLARVYRNYQQLLSSHMQTISTGTPVDFYFGVAEEDTGDYNNPDTLSALALDESFDPSTIEAQQYLVDFCDRLFDKPFVYKPSRDYKCSINKFDEWLGDQWLLPETQRAPEYDSKCNGSGSLPMSEVDFHSCFIYWSQLALDTDVLQWDGRIRILTIRAGTRMRVDMTIAESQEVWEDFENFRESEEGSAPQGVNKWFHTNPLWWTTDTFIAMIRTGRSSLYIAIVFAFLVTLISSRSFFCSVVSALSIFFILATATATLIALGWELGFLELICFSILIGISSDFVIHFSHSYTCIKGPFHREGRTLYALVNMGPSIFGATITTFAVAFMMLFCKIMFFIKFAQLLIVTISYSLLGSFVFFVAIMDIFGPEFPTVDMDKITSCRKREGGMVCSDALWKNRRRVSIET